MSHYKPPYTLTSKILKAVSEISELISDIKHIDKSHNTLTLRKKNRIRSITGTLQIEGNTFDEDKITNVINGKTVLGTMKEIEDAGARGESTLFVEFMLEIITNSLKEYVQESKKSNQKSNQKIIKQLKDDDFLLRVGSLKAGHWEIIDEAQGKK